MGLSDFWQLKDNQLFDGQPILNVYQVKRILGGATATMVAQAFLDHVLAVDMVAVQPDGVTRTTVEVANLQTVTDFAVLDSSAFPGGVAGGELPGFNAASIQFNRTRTDMKNGQKRLVAGTETEMTEGTWLPAFVTLLQAVAAAIIDPWETAAAPGVDVCEFVVMKRFCVVPAQDPCVAYRLPNNDTEADQNHYVPVSTIVRPQVRSQVSRKVLN